MRLIAINRLTALESVSYFCLNFWYFSSSTLWKYSWGQN